MYSFLNDLSIADSDTNPLEVWLVLDKVMYISERLRDYKIEKLRVPKELSTIAIGGKSSINDLLDSDLIDNEKKALIYNFLENIIEQPDLTIQERMEELQESKLIQAYFNDKSSITLTEAHIMHSPVISFTCHSIFLTPVLTCDLQILNEKDQLKDKIIKLNNLYDGDSLAIHHVFLSQILSSITYSKTKWDPIKEPIWHPNTEAMLSEMNFPENVTGKVGKYEELEIIGTKVAEMNAWKHEPKLSKNNSNSGQIRHIFSSNSGNKTAYLSIDFKRAYGAFEVHDYKGKHQGQVTFKGVFDGKPDKEGHHDIDV